jgi:RNA polymerase sigma factor (sigma-70 family)
MWFGRLLKLRYRDIVVRKQGGARRGGVRQLTNYEWQSAMATYNNGQAASADQQILVEAIATLRKQDRQLLRWKLQRLTFAEIAERLSLPRPRVRLLIRQALAALRDRLQPSPRTQPDPQLRRRCA